MNVKKQFWEGLITQNPVLVQLLGMCPMLAITTSMFNGIGMGIAVLLILVCCNIVISALRKAIPAKVRIACYVVVIAGFVTIVDLLIKAFVPALSTSLGLFIPLIVVNCIILGRAEGYASKNTVLGSTLDGVFQGIGNMVALIVMSVIRELLGAGTFGGGIIGYNEAGAMVFGFGSGAGIQVIPESAAALGMILPVGGFLTLGFLIAAFQFFLNRPKKKKEVA